MKPCICYLVMVPSPKQAHISVKAFGIFKNIVFPPQFDILLA